MTNTRKGEQGAVAEPDLEIRGEGGGGHPDPEIRRRRGGQSLKKYFPALRASGWSKNKGGPVPRFPPLDPPLGSAEVRRTREQTLT